MTVSIQTTGRTRRPRVRTQSDGSWESRSYSKDGDCHLRFIRRLGECKDSVGVSESDLLQAIPTVLSRAAADWWSAEQNEISTWREYKNAFRARFIGRLDGDDLIDSLSRRTQAKGESISGFLTAFKLKLKSFRRPPDERTQLEIIYKNLLPEY